MDLSNENVIHIKTEKIEYLQFRKLLQYSNILTHAYTLGLDKNFRVARKTGKVNEEEFKIAIKSFNELCDELKVEYKNIVQTNQAHTDNVVKIEKKINENEPDFYEYKNTDGLITNKNEIVLSTKNADCILILFFDPVKKVIANVHSGWRGTLQRISLKTVQKMQEQYGSKPEDIIACICPSIRKCHFEVDKEVYEMFNQEFQDLKNLSEIIEQKENKWHIDTVLINKIILKQFGLKEDNIIDSGICSVCNKEIVHSYRAEGETYGLSTAVISLKK